jgi:hypothetical protein
MGLGVVLDRPELEMSADIGFAATRLFHAQEPNIGVEGAVANEVK